MAIVYSETKRGDILRIVGAGAPGYAKLGDLVRVIEVRPHGVTVEDTRGVPCEFVFHCGADRLEPTEWRDDFPASPPPDDDPDNFIGSMGDPGDGYHGDGAP